MGVLGACSAIDIFKFVCVGTLIIKYDIPELSFVAVKVYDVLGNEIATLINEKKSAGSYEIEWDASNVPSGVYFYQLKTKGYVETKKMVLMK